jgi:energy-coupling factor transporter ATP-binding protein EcfA2
MSSLAEKISHILEKYPENRGKFSKDNPLFKLIVDEIPIALQKEAGNDDILYEGNAGKGRWADVPWIAIYHNKLGRNAGSGLYGAIFFSAKGSRLSVSLQQGGAKECTTRVLLDRAASVRALLGIPERGELDLESSAQRPRKYEAASCYSMSVTKSAITSKTIIEAIAPVIRSLKTLASKFSSPDNLVAWLEQHISETGMPKAEKSQEGATVSPAERICSPFVCGELNSGFKTVLANTLYSFSNAIICRFTASLATKPFVILTGNSGTGKTKLAQLFAQWLDQAGQTTASGDGLPILIEREAAKRGELVLNEDIAQRVPLKKKTGEKRWGVAYVPGDRQGRQFILERRDDGSIVLSTEESAATFRKWLLENAGQHFQVRLLDLDNQAKWCHLALEFIPVGGKSQVTESELAAYASRRWFKLSFNDLDVKPAFKGEGNVVDAMRRAILGTGYMSLGWLDNADESRASDQREMMRELRIGDMIIGYGGEPFSLLGIGEVIREPFVDNSGEAFEAFHKTSTNFIQIHWLYRGPIDIKDFQLPGHKSPAFAGWRNTIAKLNSEQAEAFLKYCRIKGLVCHRRQGSSAKGIQAGRYALVPVGADWTDNRNVLGFVNHLKQDEETQKPVFQSTPILDLVLRASQEENKDYPFFLILDEMNLSHVERYFSDFLSAMESQEEIPIHSEGCDLRTAAGVPVPPSLRIPQNLFVVGTVNVDETTYMFSPKVLDRANVIEFTVSDKDISKFLGGRSERGARGSGGIDPAPDGMAEAFLELSLRARGVDGKEPLPEPQGLDEMTKVLLDFFNVLQVAGFEFAYRTANEILRYAKVASALSSQPPAVNSVLDEQIVQKLLPRLHGSKRRIEKTLVALARLCEDGADPARILEDLEADKALELTKDAKPTFKLSYEKLSAMIRTVQRDQFVSFIQ